MSESIDRGEGEAVHAIEDLAAGRINREQFIRKAGALGISAGGNSNGACCATASRCRDPSLGSAGVDVDLLMLLPLG